MSRVGGKAQLPAYRAVAGELRLAYAQFEEIVSFARFGARLDDSTRQTIEHGRRIRACLKQHEGAPVTVPAQLAVLLALSGGLFDPVSLERMDEAEGAVQQAAAGMEPELCARLQGNKKRSASDRSAVLELVQRAIGPFVAKP